MIWLLILAVLGILLAIGGLVFLVSMVAREMEKMDRARYDR